MPTYTAKDEETGREVTFEWNGDGEPTEADMADVFAAAEKQGTPPEQDAVKGKMQAYASVGTRLGNTMRNFPGSYKNLLKGAAQTAYQVGRHPSESFDNFLIGTAKDVVSPAIGMIQKIAPGVGNEQDAQNLERVKNDFMSRYGSAENIAKYIEKDPARALADFAMLLTGGGKLLQSGGRLAEIGAMEKAGSGMMKAGAMVEPITAPFKIAGTAARPFIPSRTAQKMYASSAKMSTIMDPDVRQRLSQRLLDAEVKLNNKGFKKLADDFESMWRGVDGLIDDYVSKGPNEKRTVLDLMKGVDKWEKRAALTGNSKVVRNIKKKFIEDLTDINYVGGKPFRTLTELDAKQVNRIKRDLYKELHSKYGKDMKPLTAEIKMHIAHNAMKTIEDLIPGVIPNNKTAAAYKEMMDAIQRGVNRIENRDLFSIGMPVRAGGTAVLSEALGVDTRVGGLGGLVLGTIDLPSVKSKLAIRINKLKKQGVKLSPTATALKIGLVKAEDLKEEKRNPIYPKDWTIRK
jgi:hypothetical protein